MDAGYFTENSLPRMKIMFRNIFRIKLLGLLVVGITVTANAQDKVLEKTLNSMGYTIVSRSTPALQSWETSDLKMESKQIFVIKSVKKVPGGENLYRRMAVTIEKYKDPADAIQRLKNIQATPPGPNSKMEGPEYALREGFMRDVTQVYVVSTETYTFVADGSMHKFVIDLDKRLPSIN